MACPLAMPLAKAIAWAEREGVPWAEVFSMRECASLGVTRRWDGARRAFIETRPDASEVVYEVGWLAQALAVRGAAPVVAAPPRTSVATTVTPDATAARVAPAASPAVPQVPDGSVTEPSPAPVQLGLFARPIAPAERDAVTPGSYVAEAPSLVAYTDGSGTTAGKISGAGVVVYDGGVAVLEASRHLGMGTNNRAELYGIGIALAMTDTPAWRPRPLLVRSDSEYALEAVTRPTAPFPWAANRPLILRVRAATQGRVVTFEHVKGHSGVEGNERADALAKLGRLRVPRVARGEAA